MQPQYKEGSVLTGSWAVQNDPSPFSPSFCPRFESNCPRWTPGSHGSNFAPGSFERLLCWRQYGRLWGDLRWTLLPRQYGMQPQQWAADVIQIWLDKINSLAFLELPFTQGHTFFKLRFCLNISDIQWVSLIAFFLHSGYSLYCFLKVISTYLGSNILAPLICWWFFCTETHCSKLICYRYLPELASQASNGEITLKGEGRPDGIFSAKV